MLYIGGPERPLIDSDNSVKSRKSKRNKGAFQSTAADGGNLGDYDNYRSSSWDNSNKLSKAQLDAL